MSVAWNLNKNSGLRAAVLRDCEVTCEIVFVFFYEVRKHLSNGVRVSKNQAWSQARCNFFY